MSIDVEALARAMEAVDEEDDRLGVVGRGRKVDRIVAEYARLVPAEDEGRLREALRTYETGHRALHNRGTIDCPICAAIQSAALAATLEPRFRDSDWTDPKG